jgi:hypothetical protein
LSPMDLATMQHPEHMFEFIKATLSAAIMDGKQTPYYSDYILQSVTPVPCEAVALSNLQPIPGCIEYAPQCTACFYKKHTDSKWYRQDNHHHIVFSCSSLLYIFVLTCIFLSSFLFSLDYTFLFSHAYSFLPFFSFLIIHFCFHV